MASALLTEEELQFTESWYTPQILIECLFHDFDNLPAFDKKKFGEIRSYQFGMVSDEAIVDFELTAEQLGLDKDEEGKKEIFQMRKRVGDIYNFGARKFGKSMVTMTVDLFIDMLTCDGNKVGFSSVDLIHIKQILDPVKNALGNHPICRIFAQRLKGSPDYYIELKNHYVLNSVNFNLGSTTPGRQWFGKHVYRVYIEEASMETEDVYNKRKDAVSELGAVFRISGMTDFTPYSPAGKAFYKYENRAHVLNLPQFVNPFWDEKEKQDRMEFYGGEDSIGYRVFVKGEVVEDGVSALDMDRIRRACYLVNRDGEFTKQIKRFEITKEKFPYFRNLIVVERPQHVDRIFFCSDIGKKVTEIIINSETDDKYEYLYNIVLYNLTQQEVEEVFKFIISKVKANVVALDCGDGEGRGIFSAFELIYPKTNLVYYDGSMKIKVGFETDEAGDIVMEKGEPVYRYEKMAEFSVRRIKELLYNGRCRIPEDYKFDSQFSVVISMTSGNTTIYKCVSASGDHLFDAWKVFAIAQWLKKDFNDTEAISDEEWGTGAVS